MRKKFFTEEQISQANQKNLLEVAECLGLHLEKKHREIRAGGHGGLVFAPEKNQWICFAAKVEGEKIYGGGPIQLVMYLKDCNFIDAVNYLLGTSIDTYSASERKMEHKKRKSFQLPKAAKDFRHIYAYLIKTRKIDRWVVDEMVRRKMLYENTYHSCVFVGYDFQGIPRHCTVRGTVTEQPFRGETAGSEKRYAFHKEGSSNILHVFEAPIDAMSYLTIYPQTLEDHFVALCCLADTALEEYLRHLPYIQKIFFHLDNDQWGDQQTKKLCKKYEEMYEVWDERPDRQWKDWNEALIFLRKVG